MRPRRVSSLTLRPAGHPVQVIAVAAALLLAGCHGGDGGGGDFTAVSPSAGFSPACDSGSPCFAGSVTLQAGVIAGDMVQIQVVLNRVNTTVGVASLVIGFDATAVDYQGFSEGTALGSAPGTVYTLTEPSPGQLVATILPPAGGRSVSNDEVMITLSFKVLRIGVTGVTFLNPDVLNGSALYDPGGNMIPLGAGGWSGGQVSGS